MMRLCDSHLHVGEFYGQYNSPRAVLRMVRKLGLGRVAVSSTTTCRFPPKALSEMRELVRCGSGRVLPVLWVTKWMIGSGFLEDALQSGVEWRCLKVHGDLEPGVWTPSSECMGEVVAVARKLNVPLLIHTGEFEHCHAGLYEETVRQNPDVKFILAHGRPLDETIALLSLSNAYADTAFMPPEHMRRLVDGGFAGKVLWGTDVPINRYYYRSVPTVKYYYRLLNDFYHTVTDPAARCMILHGNFERLFGGA